MRYLKTVWLVSMLSLSGLVALALCIPMLNRMGIAFDWTITLGQMVHVAILIGFVYTLHHQAQIRLRTLDSKLDALLAHLGLTFDHKGGTVCTSSTPSQSETS